MSFWEFAKFVVYICNNFPAMWSLYLHKYYLVISFQSYGDIFKINSIVIHCLSMHCLLSWSLGQFSCSFVLGGEVGEKMSSVTNTHAVQNSTK